MNKKFYFFFSVLVLNIFLSCSFKDKCCLDIKVSVDKTVVAPSEKIHFQVTELPDGADLSLTEWFVNGVKQETTGGDFLLQTENKEQRYFVQTNSYRNSWDFCGGIGLYCYSTNNEKLLKAVCSYNDKWNYKPAISVTIYGKDVNFNYASGYASVSDKTENLETTPHILYSITKSFTAAAILKLRDEGKLQLTDRLDKYVTGLSSVYVNNDATIEELLNHTSGISDYTTNSQLFIHPPFTGDEVWEQKKIFNYIESPADEKGNFNYSSANYIILGLIVEKVSGDNLNKYVRNNFLIPLGLEKLLLAPQDSVTYTDLAHPHVYPNTFMGLAGDGETPVDITDVISDAVELLCKCGWAAGGMTGTSDVTAKWGYNLLSSNGSVTASIRNSILDSVSMYDENAVSTDAYGFAVRKLYYNHKEFIGSYGRSVGDENLMFYNADKDVCIVILTSSNMKNDNTPNIDELMYSLYDAL